MLSLAAPPSLVATAGGGAYHSQKAVAQIGDFLIVLSVILAIVGATSHW